MALYPQVSEGATDKDFSREVEQIARAVADVGVRKIRRVRQGVPEGRTLYRRPEKTWGGI